MPSQLVAKERFPWWSSCLQIIFSFFAKEPSFLAGGAEAAANHQEAFQGRLVIGYLLVIGHRLFVGYWSAVICWLLVIGYLLVIGHRLFVGYWSAVIC